MQVDPSLGLRRTPIGRREKYAIVAVVAVLVVIVGAIALTGYYRHAGGPGSAGFTLAPVGWSATSLPYGQFGDIPFVTSSTQSLTGSFETANEITVYLMTASQFEPLVKNDTVGGYEWTTGQVWNGNISYTVPAGSWDLVFLNTNIYGASGVSITTAVVLTPT
jgi:hypothetical protein